MPIKFIIDTNAYLHDATVGYYHQDYMGYDHPDNPQFLLTLKNTFANTNNRLLAAAQAEVVKILLSDIPEIMKENKINSCICVCVPRAKASQKYSKTQLMFKEAVCEAVAQLVGVADGTDCIERTIDTCTTHLAKATEEGRLSIDNSGSKPYPGITIETCSINATRFRGQNVILIDDIYTKTVNIDEDCIQALYQNGAKKVIFYAIGKTRRDGSGLMHLTNDDDMPF